MLYGRDGDALYLHGSVASRLLRTLAGGIDVCLTVTLVDGLVLARSAFHHSMNYRSVVVFGRAVAVEGEEKEHGMRIDQRAPGPGPLGRGPPAESVRSCKQTSVLRLDIDGGIGQGPHGRPDRRRRGPGPADLGRRPAVLDGLGRAVARRSRPPGTAVSASVLARRGTL